MDLEFRQLRDFLAVIESGSLGNAARRLATSQPTLTRSIKALKQTVGSAIFDRSPQGMHPTAERALERRARIILGELGSTQSEIDDLVEGRRGQVTVGAAGTLDRAFHGAPDGLSALDLTHRVLMRGQTIAVVAHRDHPLAREKHISLAEIARQPWLLPPAPDFLRTRFDTLFERAGLTPPTPLIEYVSTTGAPHFLFDNKSLVTFLVDTMFEHQSNSRHLARLNVPGFQWRAETSVIFRRGMPMPPAAALFVEHVRAVCKALARP